MIKGGKKGLAHGVLSRICSLVMRRKIIIFDAYSEFHFKHFVHVINEMAGRDDFDIYVLGIKSSDLVPENVKFFPHSSGLPIHRKIVAFITTEFNRTVYWLDCPVVYFGHGASPKLNYIASDHLKGFDYVFSSCRPIFDAQEKHLKKGAKIVEVGLPMLEEVGETKAVVKKCLGLDADKKTILYAPSWCIDIEKISDIYGILDFLQRLSKASGVDVIISPHPLLFEPERCSGKQFFENAHKYDGVYVNKPGGRYSTLDLVRISDVTISDISSVMFEAMALGKAVVFDGNREIYEYSKSLSWLDCVKEVCITPDWADASDTTLLDIMSNDPQADERSKFIKQYIFNIGRSRDVFVKNVYDIVLK